METGQAATLARALPAPRFGVNTAEIKIIRQASSDFGPSTINPWFHIRSRGRPAEHHSTVGESCVYVTQWRVTECYVRSPHVYFLCVAIDGQPYITPYWYDSEEYG